MPRAAVGVVIWVLVMQNDKELFGVIFDMDGVLIDTGAYHMQAWSDVVVGAGYVFDEDLFRSTFGMQNYQILPIMFNRPVSEQEVEELSLWKEERFRELIAGDLEFSPGVESLLVSLRQAGVKTAVGTSAPRKNLEFIMENLKAEAYFDATVAGEDVARGKPAPDTFVCAAGKLGLPVADCIVIEDAIIGVEAAHAGGMKVIAVTATYPRESLGDADLVVDSLKEVDPSIIKAITLDRS